MSNISKIDGILKKADWLEATYLKEVVLVQLIVRIIY